MHLLITLKRIQKFRKFFNVCVIAYINVDVKVATQNDRVSVRTQLLKDDDQFTEE